MLPPPQRLVSNLPVLESALSAYKLWHAYHGQFPRLSRFSLGGRIDTLFTDLIELLLAAGYISREHKAHTVAEASRKLDTLKFFIQVAWEVRCLDHAKFAALAKPLGEVGKMLGGWQESLKKKQPVLTEQGLGH